MSQEATELAHRALDAFNRRDLDAFLTYMDPEVELSARFMELEGSRSFRGHDGVREWWRALLTVFPDFRIEVLDAREFGDWMILAMRVQGHGLDSGVPVDEEVWQAGRVRGGKVVWWRNFGSEADALEAAGVRE